ncbi:MAG: PilC/PilY family type IV pilus protein [Gammaproteobacteria bacterium]|nr:PilC/PilY family type IV pilus protein [Gammaproteobacteria bacterium]
MQAMRMRRMQRQDQTRAAARAPAPWRATAGGGLLALAAAIVTMGPAGPAAVPAHAVVSSATLTDYTAFPPFVGTAASGVTLPRFLIAMSRDEQLFYAAYDGLQDLDGDGRSDLGYKPAVQYYGYFDPDKCYAYRRNTANLRFGNGDVLSDSNNWFFDPQAFSPQDSLGNYTRDCSGVANGRWSGNYLNWATMTRLDLLRKVLYGGRRLVDEADITSGLGVGNEVILEGASIPPDSHSFARVLQGPVIEEVTPVSTGVNYLTSCRSVYRSQAGRGGILSGSSTWAYTYSASGIRIASAVFFARGNFPFWDFVASTTGRACYTGSLDLADFATDYPGIYRDLGNPEEGSPGDPNSVDDTARIGQVYLGVNNLNTPSDAIDATYRAAVQVCVANLINADNNENCKQYPGAAGYKPIGILQEYGEAGLAEFGLFSGSYSKSKTGGVLRKRLRAFDDEIEASGVIRDVDLNAYPGDGRIIWFLDNLAVAGYSPGGHSASSFRPIPRGMSFGNYNCPTVFISNPSQFLYPIYDDCLSWGNPLGEIFYEAASYLAGASALSAFDADDTNPPVDRSAFGNPLMENRRLHRVTYGNNDALMPAIPPGSEDCRPMNVLLINSGTVSQDGDDLPTSRSFNNGGNGNSLAFAETEIVRATDDIGTQENIAGQYVVGSNGVSADIDYACSPKTVSQLSDVEGLCPAAPTLGGTYLMAGAAYYAHITDLRTDLQGDQTVNTVAVDLRPVLPELRIPIGDPASATRQVLLQPAYLNSNQQLDDNPGFDPAIRISGTMTVRPTGGRLVKFLPVVDHELQADGTYRGLYMVGWEDSIEGTDFDHDILGSLEYVVDAAANTIRVTTDILSESAGQGIHLFGFTIQGTTQDGFHAYSGHTAGATAFGPSEYDNPVANVPSCGHNRGGVDLRGREVLVGVTIDWGCRTMDAAVGHTFAVGSSTAQRLRTPLFYAAKYGGFKDSNNNNRPDLVAEWDTVDTLGNVGADGLPDNYIPVTNPTNIDATLRQALVQGGVTQRTASGTAAALVANEREGLGAVFQALFEPERSDSLNPPLNPPVRWLGTLQALFVDVNSLFREDSDQDGTLDDYQTDKVVVLFYDDAEGETRVRRFDSSQPNTFESSSVEVVDLEELNALWNAREHLNLVAASNFTASANRVDYDDTNITTAGSLRYIFTWIEDPSTANDIADSNEVRPFTAVAFQGARSEGSLDVGPYIDSGGVQVRDARQNAAALVAYLRGEPAVAGQRPRQLGYRSTDTSRVTQMLGDIVHSSPVAVAAPAEAYDLLANDATYTNFRRRWAQRRQVVYVGANDGMLHAFNAGFYNPASDSFTTASASDPNAAARDLGEEIWAYVPRALHPYLKWLADPNYTHGYYVDAPPRVFDVKAFDTDSVHTDGWGTILVAGFRLGGGGPVPVPVDTQSDGLGAGNTDGDVADDRSFRSAFVVLDITNPEDPPVLIAELSDTTMGFTTARPVVVPVRGSSPTDRDRWFLVLGSGPDQRNGNIGGGALASLYVYDIAVLLGSQGQTRSVSPERKINILTDFDHFVGGITVADFDLDLRAEALYYGTLGSTRATAADPAKGALYRLQIGEDTDPSSWGNPVELLDTDQPIFAAPTLAVDEEGNRWVYAGSGRLLSDDDEATTPQETLYGIIDPNDPFAAPGDPQTLLTRALSTLLDVSNARVLTNGQVDSNGDGTLDETFNNMRARAIAAGGWRRDYRIGTGTTPAQRSLNSSTLLGSVLFNTAFSPPATATTAACASGGLGESEVLGLDFRSGLPQPQGVFGTQTCAFAVCSDEVSEALGTYNLGAGLASLPSLHLGQPGEDVPGRLTVVVQQSTGEIQSVEALGLQPADSGEVSWREYLE